MHCYIFGVVEYTIDYGWELLSALCAFGGLGVHYGVLGVVECKIGF